MNKRRNEHLKPIKKRNNSNITHRGTRIIKNVFCNYCTKTSINTRARFVGGQLNVLFFTISYLCAHAAMDLRTCRWWDYKRGGEALILSSRPWAKPTSINTISAALLSTVCYIV